MRRLPRLGSSATVAALPTSSTACLRTPAASLFKCGIALTSATQPHSVPRQRHQVWANRFQTQRRCLSSAPPPPASTPEKAVDGALDVLAEAPIAAAEAQTATDLTIPRKQRTVPRPADIPDAEYVPAGSGLDLEEVGGLEGWWDNPAHWGPSKNYVGFGLQEKVMDSALLQVLARKALVEAIALKDKFESKIKNYRRVDPTPAEFRKAELIRISSKEILVAEDGSPTLAQHDVYKALKALSHRLPVAEGEVLPKPVGPAMTPEEAKELLESWDRNWKAASIENPVLRFYLVKRIQRLTGHVIPDAKLVGVKHMGGLLSVLVRPPKALKLAELITTKSLLPTLPNVKIYPRRVTPVDKEKMVGRWKLIQKELQERGLPVVGTGGYGAAVEKKWKIRIHVLTAWSLASWRVPIGDSGLLDLFLAVIPDAGLPPLLKKHTLRLLGNSAADCDENRARVVESGQLGSTLIRFLQDDFLLPFAVLVFLNMCVDCASAQRQASEAGLSRVLVDILSGERLQLCESSLGPMAQVLGLIANQDSEPKVANPATPALILELATSRTYPIDLEDFTELCTVALVYLTYEQFQQALVESRKLEVLQQAFDDSCTRFDAGDADQDVKDQLKQTFTSWLGTPASLSHLQTAACLSLGNLSRSDEASTALARADGVVDSLAAILSRAVPPPPQQQPSSTPRPPPSPQLTHAALGFLKNLAIPPANKALLGSRLLASPGPLRALWTTTTAQPQVQFAAVSLARLLLVNCTDNVRLVCSTTTPNDTNTSSLQTLTELRPHLDAEPTRIEIARAVCAVCRALHSSSDGGAAILLPADANTSRQDVPDDDAVTNFYTVHGTGIASALASLLTQTRFEAVRSEAVFVLALMSRTNTNNTNNQSQSKNPGGQIALQVLAAAGVVRALATVVVGGGGDGTDGEVEKEVDAIVLQDDDDVSAGEEEEEQQQSTPGTVTPATTLANANPATGGLVDGLGLEPQQADPKQAAGLARVDQENALVLVAEILGSFADQLPPSRMATLEKMLSKGSELVRNNRKQVHA
ncbi:hypothetical protein B0T24DRAFT_526613 [Lasiosphaeria ovina]|uniref:Large ribosomal subunit protein mL50 n=1 Tax=Lasiosphaeria ovina TaxID=92902 RepID=A0AAE0N9L7_9PEZI|nr:hypothetical protein B0T24DRAFT_526613 [Lasiosphaeria ovina]